MRRNAKLAVEVAPPSNEDLHYDLDLSPRSSVFSHSEELKKSPSMSSLPEPTATEPTLPSHPQAQPQPLNPSIRLLFSHLTPRHRILLLCPAILTSIISGGVAPFMTYVIGEAFNSFAQFPLTPNPPQEAKDALLRGVGLAAIQLVGLAAGSLILSSLTSSLWIWTGEYNVMAVRKRVYSAVTRKDMVWFDTKMGSEGTVQSADGESGPIGAGGLMAKFTRETDDVRMASSLASGLILQYLTTCITCLVLAFMRSWQLTLVILSAVPVLMIIQAFSQAFAGPLLAIERTQSAAAATLIDRTISAIATVKAFNAAAYEQATLSNALESVRAATRKLNAVWGLTSTMAQFVMMAMFVQGFWFGAKLVKEGRVGAGDVMAVFWACLIATSNLQMCIPRVITLSKGKFAIVALLALVDGDNGPLTPAIATATTPGPTSPSVYSLYANPKAHKKASKIRSTQLRKIVPTRCWGEIALHNITFAYPSRPNVPVLQDVSLYLPANEMTFIVGASGSGKSTVAQLLLRMYEPQRGVIHLDDQDVRYLDERWTREHLAAVSQNVVLFDMSVHDNVAMGVVDGRREAGRRPEEVTREEVVEACRVALMHEFVRDLPEGYETVLGSGGAALSGGQKQRLAIARARLRDPTVLILDEATSALDATSRILVFEAIKHWRAHKTTIVITHDLSQITHSDFVYVLKHGSVVEQGYRADLESSRGEFRNMMETQRQTGGYLPEKQLEGESGAEEGVVERMLGGAGEESEGKEGEEGFSLRHRSLARPALRPLTLGNWMFDVVADLASGKAPEPAVVASREAYRVGRWSPEPSSENGGEGEGEGRQRRPSSLQIEQLPSPGAAYTLPSRKRFSLQFTPTTPSFSVGKRWQGSVMVEDDEEFEGEKDAMQRTGALAATSRRRLPRTRWDALAVKVDKPASIKEQEKEQKKAEDEKPKSALKIIRVVFPSIPCKPLLFFGLFICVCSGAMTPIFSYLLSRLLFEVSIGAHNSAVINQFGGIVLTMAALDGIFLGLKYFLMETAAMSWITSIRNRAYLRVISQDKRWFDDSENAAARLVQVIVKDGDDAKNLVAVVMGQFLVVSTMLSVGLIWALVRGWELTLVGFAIAPVFGGTMAVQTALVAKCEVRNKRAREDVAKGYYEAISNIRGIRAMGFESVFGKQFDAAADRALSTGVRGAFVEGCTYGVASGLIYLAEALLFYVGAVLIARGTYTYLQMVEVLNLVVFTVTIGSQLMAFTQRIAKSVQATSDFNTLLNLPLDTDESKGSNRPPIAGDITFNHVQFSYPTRPEAPVLRDVNVTIASGECVAVVGASGSGKSTITALLQRLYEPTSGAIAIGSHLLSSMDVNHLRKHISVVSQNPNLFDATISENIAYGSGAREDGQKVSQEDIEKAAKAANVHDFILSLPDGYGTLVGENASLISGGQAQRLSIARALCRPANILILDECTSALDPANQAAVMETIKEAKKGRTTIMVTHKLEVMKMCDRILVVDEGEIKEEGRYEELIEKKGVFATLASGGEWVGE